MGDPHGAYIDSTKLYEHKYNLIMRKIKGTQFLRPLDEVLDSTFIPAMFNGRIVDLILRNISCMQKNS